MNFRLTAHVQQQAAAKGIDLAQLQRVLANPDRITKVTRYENQARYIGEGIAVIVCTTNGAVITVYLDGVITPLRPDQIARGEQIQRNH